MSITLDALPLDVIHHIAQQLAADPKRRVRDVVSLAFSSKSLYSSISKLDGFWARWSRSIFGRSAAIGWEEKGRRGEPGPVLSGMGPIPAPSGLA